MKRFTKTLLSVAAVSAVSAAMAVSAMAADMSASYAGDTVTLADVKSTGAQQTLLILDGAETVVENADGSNNIVQIDQKDDGTVFATTKVGTLKDGTYYVRIGGTDGTLQKYTLPVSSTSATTKEITVGDTNLDGSIKGADVTYLLRYNANATKGTGNVGEKYKYVSSKPTFDISEVLVGDTNLDGSIKGADVTYLLRYNANATKGTGNVGQTLTVVETPIAE